MHGEADFGNTILFDGIHDQNIASSKPHSLTLQNVEITKPQGSLILHTDVQIGTQLTFENGILQTQNHHLIIDYTTNPTIHIEQNAQIIGNLESIQQVGTDEVVIEAADLIIGAGEDNLGTTSVIRRTGEAATIENDGAKSIQRNWEIHTQTPLTQPRQLTFMWNEGEDDDMDLSNMSVWKKTSSGNWIALGDFEDGTERVISALTDELTQFTITDAHNPLPIKLLSFEATLELDHVLLKWSTISEQNNMGFEVQKSLDGQTFYPIGFVNGQGTSREPHEYQFEDRDIFISAYYRLKQVDFDGKTTFSPIRFLPINGNSVSISIAPNPILKGARLNVYTQDPINSPHIEYCVIYNSSGVLTYENNRITSLKQLEDELNLIFMDMPKGLYILRLVSTIGLQKIKLWKE